MVATSLFGDGVIVSCKWVHVTQKQVQVLIFFAKSRKINR